MKRLDRDFAPPRSLHTNLPERLGSPARARHPGRFAGIGASGAGTSNGS
jgi:hypothetical protein